MALVLTRKGIITTLVLFLVLIAVGVGGYIAWTTINAENLGNEDSSAGADVPVYCICTGSEPCNNGLRTCTTKPAGKSSCITSNQVCDGYSRCHCCNGDWIVAKDCNNACKGSGGYGKCDEEDPNFECVCESYAGCGVNCTFPPGTQGRVDAAAEGTCDRYMAMCVMDGAGNTKVEIGPAGACWAQRDICKNPTAEDECTPDNPGVCFEACGTGCPTGLSCQNNICVNPSCPTAADCQCNSAWTITKSAAVVCVNENTPQVASQVDYTIAITFNSNGQTGQIGSVLDEFTTSPVTIQNSWFGNISTGGSLATGTTTGGSILWTLTGDNRNFIAGQTRTFTFRMTVPGAPYDAVNQTSPSFGNYTNRVTADVLTPNATQDLVISRTTLVGCDIPATGIFDSTFSKVMLAMVLILVGYIYFASSKVEGMMLGMYQGIENTVGKEALDRKKIMKTRDTFEDRVTKE
jgi:hypothetical protein